MSVLSFKTLAGRLILCAAFLWLSFLISLRISSTLASKIWKSDQVFRPLIPITIGRLLYFVVVFQVGFVICSAKVFISLNSEICKLFSKWKKEFNFSASYMSSVNILSPSTIVNFFVGFNFVGEKSLESFPEFFVISNVFFI